MNKNIKPKRMRKIDGTGKLRISKAKKAALAASALTLAITLTACAGADEPTDGTSASTQTGSTGSTGSTGAVVQVQDGTHTSTFTEEIPFGTVYIDDPEAYEDEQTVLSEGKAGKLAVTEHSVYLGGKLQGTYRETEVLAEAEDRVIKRGTKPIISTEENTLHETLEKHSTIYLECDTMEVGTTKIKTEGRDGVAVRTYRYTYTKGELTGTELLAEEITERVDRVILVGTKKQSFGMPFIDAAHGGVNYKLTQSFGGSNSHRGLDFAVYYGDPIIAVMDGTVIEAYDAGYFSKNNLLWTYGTYVVIQHENGFRTCYAHLSRRTVSVGDKVKKGQTIGASGNTGRLNTTATGPYAGTHLHFELRKYNAAKGAYTPVDPKLYLPWWS